MIYNLLKRTPFEYKCPFCNKHTTIVDTNYLTHVYPLSQKPESKNHGLTLEIIVCPNTSCRKYSINLYHNYIAYAQNRIVPAKSSPPISKWVIEPRGNYIEFPDYIAIPILEDYKEACLIKDLSPKASATLARRCLQGMIRDFWGISKRSLAKEIEAIKDKVDPDLYKAIDAIRSVGNIGAHMEENINMIIDIEHNEAEVLIKLIEILMEEWYIKKYARDKLIKQAIELAEVKKEEKNNN